MYENGRPDKMPVKMGWKCIFVWFVPESCTSLTHAPEAKKLFIVVFSLLVYFCQFFLTIWNIHPHSAQSKILFGKMSTFCLPRLSPPQGCHMTHVNPGENQRTGVKINEIIICMLQLVTCGECDVQDIHQKTIIFLRETPKILTW